MSRYRFGRQGFALVASLMILIIISMIGVVALRSSAFSNKVSMGVQLDSIVFEAAESAIADTMANMVAFNSSSDEEVFAEIQDLFNGETITWCMLESGARKLVSCSDGDVMDSRGIVQAESRTKSTGYKPVSGHQISTTGSNAVMFADFELSIQGDAQLVGFNNLQNRHVQQALRRGMIPSKEIE